VAPSNTHPELLCVIGEEKRIDSVDGAYSLPAKPSVNIRTLTLVLNDVLVDIPSRTEMEKRICSVVRSSLKSNNEAKIVARSLKAC
jgi:hypothetical protein